MTRPYLFLSPHFDDAALSSGGLIRQMVLEENQVIVVTIFGGEPPLGDVSPFAADLHARWEEIAHPTLVRGEEDHKAMGVLGADYLHLSFPDAIYRAAKGSFLYQSEQALFGPLRNEDGSLVPQIAAAVQGFAPLRDTMVYVPLAVGNHVDHQLVRDAMMSLNSPAGRLAFYEDYPYVETPGALTQALEDLQPAQLELEFRELDEQYVKAKIEAISSYRSQMTALFDAQQAVAQRVRDYMRAISPEYGFAEKYWRLKRSTPSSREDST